ncbi:oligoendopeptidase F [Alkalicoccus luteus]|uniref:Oligopeptidase F n=1 Tax=Alkalicoccus luteus TaxID=1237094 RepID=A0A969Q127_9BACI|nr:oligoendopeptidase F [Alkalicoccus luteus]NJP39152.1 oligoendopeptidase F [Alkalicoccus luteus]
MSTTELPVRSEIPKERTWDLEDIYATDEKWEADFEQLKQELPQIAAYQGKLAESGSMLFKALQKEDELSIRLGRLFVYARMRYDEDTTNAHYQGLNEKARQLLVQFGQQSSYITPEILAMPEEKLKQFLRDEPELKLYEHALERLNKKRPHVLTEKEEALMARFSDVSGASSNTFSMLNNADLRFPEVEDEEGNMVEVTQGRFVGMLQSQDRRVRRDAFHAMYSTYKKFHHTFASTLSGEVKKHLLSADVRKYENARQAALAANHIPEVVYDQLVDTINKNLPLLHRYVAVRKKVLELEEMHMYDLYTPMIQDVDFSVSYDEAKELMVNGLGAMGEEYRKIVEEGLNNRWVDVEESKGKRSGAYSSGTYGTKPYILMNWQNDINNLFTLAHEFGHSVHSYYTRKHQPYPYANYSIFVAEVASTTNEALLNRYLLDRETDTRRRLYLLNNFLEGFRATVFRQTMFAEFEQLIHEKAEAGTPLTADLLNNLYYDLNIKYFGDELVIDEDITFEWQRIPHFYMNFYVYQYATGYSAATALAQQILDEGEPAVKRFTDFLKAGNSDYPIDVLKHAGVDMTSAEPIQQALDVFESVLDEFEEQLKSL